MKNFIALLSIFITSNLFAQKVITDGTLTYNITIQTAKGEKQLSNALNGAVLTVFLSKNKSRTEMVSTPGTESAVFDNTLAKGFILKEYSGQKLMFTLTADNWALRNASYSNFRFKISDETTIVAGFVCKKATTVTNDGKIYTVYFDPQNIIVNKNYNNAFPQLEGMPVAFELQSGNMIFKYTLAKYTTDAVASSKFDSPKTGFRVLTYEENQQLKKGE